jgi:hypothetical protein
VHHSESGDVPPVASFGSFLQISEAVVIERASLYAKRR